MHVPPWLNPLSCWQRQRCRRWCACLAVGLVAFGLVAVIVLGVRDWVSGPTARDRWVARQVRELNGYTPTPDEVGKAQSLMVEEYLPRRSPLPRRGLIGMPDGSWFYLVAHSYHDEENTFAYRWWCDLPWLWRLWPRSSPWIGDVALVKCSDGAFYVNYGHICGCCPLNFVRAVAPPSGSPRNHGWGVGVPGRG